MSRALSACFLPALAAAGALAWPVGGAHAQTRIGLGDPVTRSDVLYAAEEPREAYDVLRSYLEGAPDRYDALWKAARAAVVVGLTAEDSREQNRFLDQALDFARRAVALNPDGLEARYWRGVAAGRRAMNASSGYAADLAQVAYDDAHAILAVDPDHAGAHNILGKLNFEVMTLSRVERAVARAFMGKPALRDTSWEGAEAQLVRAVELAPRMVLYRYDLGRLYARRGRDADAAVQLREATRLPTYYPLVDEMLRADAQRLLARLEGEGKGG